MDNVSQHPATSDRRETPEAELAKAQSAFQPVSRLNGAISEWGVLRKSLLFAELLTIAYMDPPHAAHAAAEIGLPTQRFFDRDGAQAYFFSNEVDRIIAFRGTEPTDWNDIRADLYALQAAAETVGRVHVGFKAEVDDLWPKLEEELKDNRKTLWFTGHSLGGAMATICAGRCKLSYIPSDPAGLFTYGSPRVGNRRYVRYAKIEHYRWVNNNDIVTRVPPAWSGYRHCGVEMYLDRHGRLRRRLAGWARTADRLQGLLRGLLRWEVDYLADHSMMDYIRYISNAIRKDERIPDDRELVDHGQETA